MITRTHMKKQPNIRTKRSALNPGRGDLVLDVLVCSAQSIIGLELVCPDGKPIIAAAMVTMQPGEETGWHRHDAPFFAWIIEAELTLDYGPERTREYKSGDGFIETFRSEHIGHNTGKGHARVLALFAGSDAISNTGVSGN